MAREIRSTKYSHRGNDQNDLRVIEISAFLQISIATLEIVTVKINSILLNKV